MRFGYWSACLWPICIEGPTEYEGDLNATVPRHHQQQQQQQQQQSDCRCVPGDSCWPSLQSWQSLNDSISGQLIADTPVASACYPGPSQNAFECRQAELQWSNATFQAQSPVGYVYPLSVDCPPVSIGAGQQPMGHCTLGNAPVYTVNATAVDHVSAGIAFAQEHNLRLVVRTTGHDLLGRSAGYGSLQIWIKYLRTGITFHENFTQPGSSWNGGALTIGGGYVWSDVNPIAERLGVIVVGGGTPSVSCLGGWMQGGGHGPATHAYGLGADQVLQAQVVLADGRLVTASPSENEDLFFAIRGGGPAAYGVVVRTTVKAWPTTGVVAQTLAFAPLSSNDTAAFIQSLADLYEAFPDLSDAGWGGYGQWMVDGAVPVFASFTTGYAHTAANFRSSLSESQVAFEPLRQKLAAKNGTSLYVYLSYSEEPTYAQYYKAYSGVEQPAGLLSQLGGRLLDRRALTFSRSMLLETLHTVAGEPGQYTVNVVEFLSGPSSRIALDGDPSTATAPISAVNPAWRRAVVDALVGRSWAADTPTAAVAAINHDVTCVKTAAWKKLAPDTGAYMNQADRLDPDWRTDFYGRREYEVLTGVKAKYDPHDLFFCHTCVGSERWGEMDGGRLCMVERLVWG